LGSLERPDFTIIRKPTNLGRVDRGGDEIFPSDLWRGPVFIVAYAGKSASGQWDTRSTAAALQNFRLVAYAEGLGGVWTDGILVKEPEINALLGIEGRKLVAVVPLGYPDELPRVPPRRSGRVQWVGFE